MLSGLAPKSISKWW